MSPAQTRPAPPRAPDPSPPTVIGAGGVGLLLAHLLAPSGPVQVLARGATLSLLEDEGFVVFDQGVHHHQPPALSWQAWSEADTSGPVLVAVKAGDLASVLEGLRSRPAGIECLYLCQNGLGILEQAAAALPDTPAVRVSCYTGVEREGPTSIRVHGRGPFRLAAPKPGRPHIEWLTAALSRAGFPPQVVGSPHRMEWEKAMMNLVLNGVCTVLDAPNAGLLETEASRALAREVLAECLAVAEARGVRVKATMERDLFAAVERVGENFNSTLQDLRAGAASELPYLHGRMLEWAEEAGVATPATRTLYRLLVHLEETGVRRTWPRTGERRRSA